MLDVKLKKTKTDLMLSIGEQADLALDKQETIELETTAKQIMLFPFFSENAGAVPAYTAKSGVFAPDNSRDDPYMHNRVYYQDEKVALKFSGFRLNQSDADVLMAVLSLMRGNKVGLDGKIRIKRSVLLKMVRWPVCGSNYALLLSTLKRLNESQFYLETPDQDHDMQKKSKALKLFGFEQMSDDMLVLWIPSESMSLFDQMSYLDINARQNIGNRMELAKALQLFASGFSHEPTKRMLVKELKEIMGRKSKTNLFIPALERAFEELQRVNVFTDTWIRKEMGEWYCGWTLINNHEET